MRETIHFRLFMLFVMLLIVAVASMVASGLPMAVFAATIPVTAAVALTFVLKGGMHIREQIEGGMVRGKVIPGDVIKVEAKRMFMEKDADALWRFSDAGRRTAPVGESSLPANVHIRKTPRLGYEQSRHSPMKKPRTFQSGALA